MNIPCSRRIVFCFGLIAAPLMGCAAETGWKSGLDVVIEGSAGLHGGAQNGSALLGTALAHVDWTQPENPERPVRLHTYASALLIAGKGPSERFLGDFLAASNVEGYPSTRLFTWWLEATSGDWSLRAGALLADEEFTGTEAGGNLFNSAFGWPAAISANTLNTGPAYFVAAPGVRLSRSFGETAAWRLGVYDGDAFDSADGDPAVTRHGLHYQVGGSQGAFVISELALTPAGSLNRGKLGAWMHTAKFADVRDDLSGRRLASTGGEPKQHAGNYGVYATWERTLHGKAGAPGYVTAHVRGGLSPADRNTLGWTLDTAVAGTGLLPFRPTDVTAFGLVHASFSSRFAANARATDPAAPAPDFEQVLELNHSMALSEAVTVQPDLQYIRHPGGSRAQRDALVFLLRVKAGF